VAEGRGQQAAGWRRRDLPGAAAFCHLPSDSDFACSGLGAGAAFERLGPLGCTGCPASTCGLSTWWSTTALGRDLVLRRVSRLDAFSGYPDRT
jgi:hypothetical protein